MLREWRGARSSGGILDRNHQAAAEGAQRRFRTRQPGEAPLGDKIKLSAHSYQRPDISVAKAFALQSAPSFNDSRSQS